MIEPFGVGRLRESLGGIRLMINLRAEAAFDRALAIVGTLGACFDKRIPGGYAALHIRL